MTQTKITLTKHEADALVEGYKGSVPFEEFYVRKGDNVHAIPGTIKDGDVIDVDEQLIGETVVLKKLDKCDCRGMNPIMTIHDDIPVSDFEVEIMKILEHFSGAARLRATESGMKTQLYFINKFTVTFNPVS